MPSFLPFVLSYARSGILLLLCCILTTHLSFGQLCDDPDSTWLVTPCYIAGDPLAGNPDNADAAAIVRIPYLPTNPTEASSKTVLATGSQVGTVWGLAYQRKTKTLFASTVLKRHAGMGPLGPGGIYVMDPISGEFDMDNSFSLEEFGIDVGSSVITNESRNLPSAAIQQNRDPLAFNLVARVGFGDIEISEDEEYLWTVNLFDQKLYRIKVGVPFQRPTADDITAYDIPGFCNDNSRLAPWGLSVNEGRIYVGVVCPALASEQSGDLKATVYAFDADNTVWESILEVDLNYPRGIVERFGFEVSFAAWRPWLQSWQDLTATVSDLNEFGYPQPILSDIEFEQNGDMILGFLDRAGLQFGFEAFSTIPGDINLYVGDAAGDILRACLQDDGTFILENNAALCNGLVSEGENNQQGPGGGEFYSDDFYFDIEFNIVGHDEITLGGLASLPFSDEIATTVYDPLAGFPFSGGVHWYGNAVGNLERAFLIYDAELQGGFGKAAGLGDLEMVCNSLPVVDPPIDPPVDPPMANDTCPEVNICLLSDYNSDSLSGHAIFLKPSPVESLIADKSTLVGDLTRFDWVSQGRYIAYEDYSVVSGIVANDMFPDAQFEVELIISDLQDWDSWSAKGRGFKASAGSEVAAAANHPSWTFGILDVQSKLIGRGTLAGDSIGLTPRPSNLSMGVQIGVGANDKNELLGISTWFNGSGTVQGQPFTLKGDLNVNVDSCMTDSICPPAVNIPQVVQINIVDAATDELLQPLTDGDTLYLSALPVFLNFAVQTSPRIVGSVSLELLAVDGQRMNVQKVENQFPYAVFGDRNGDYGTQKLPGGQYVLSTTPFNARRESGLRGETTRLSFIIIDDLADISVLSLFPNPATTEIQLIPVETGADVEVLAIQSLYGGALPIEATFDGSNWFIPVHQLEKGLYLVKARVGETVVTEKFWVKR